MAYRDGPFQRSLSPVDQGTDGDRLRFLTAGEGSRRLPHQPVERWCGLAALPNQQVEGTEAGFDAGSRFGFPRLIGGETFDGDRLIGSQTLDGDNARLSLIPQRVDRHDRRFRRGWWLARPQTVQAVCHI